MRNNVLQLVINDKYSRLKETVIDLKPPGKPDEKQIQSILASLKPILV